MNFLKISWTLWKANKEKNFLRMEMLFRVYNTLIMIIWWYYALLLEFKFFTISSPLVVFSHIKGFLNISTNLFMKISLVDPNLLCTLFGNMFWVIIMVLTFKNSYFLFRTKFGYLRYWWYKANITNHSSRLQSYWVRIILFDWDFHNIAFPLFSL